MPGIFDDIDALLAQEQQPEWTGSFRQYLQLVIDNPRIAQRAHARLYTMMSQGITVDTDNNEHYPFFEEDLFGIEKYLPSSTDIVVVLCVTRSMCESSSMSAAMT